MSPSRRLGISLLAACFSSGCGSDDTHPPPAPIVNTCEDWNCPREQSPTAAVAVEHAAASDGGGCDSWRFSMPAGGDAFTSIRSCGGNQIRCGSSDYRVGATEPGTTLTCVVAPSSKVLLHGRLSQSNGAHFEVDGEVDPTGGTVTISAGASPDGSAVDLGPASCRVTDVHFLVPGSIWADFDCASSSDAATCTARGTFVFESCAKESDAG